MRSRARWTKTLSVGCKTRSLACLASRTSESERLSELLKSRPSWPSSPPCRPFKSSTSRVQSSDHALPAPSAFDFTIVLEHPSVISRSSTRRKTGTSGPSRPGCSTPSVPSGVELSARSTWAGSYTPRMWTGWSVIFSQTLETWLRLSAYRASGSGTAKRVPASSRPFLQG